MLLTLSITVPPVLRSSRTFALLGVGLVAVASVVWYQMTREEPDPVEMERERRNYLATSGRIVDGSITETQWINEGEPNATPTVLIYRYRIAGVTYECAQDVRPLPEHVRHVRMDLPVQVRFDPRNPGDSIVVAEEWSGLRSDGEHSAEVLASKDSPGLAAETAAEMDGEASETAREFSLPQRSHP